MAQFGTVISKSLNRPRTTTAKFEFNKHFSARCATLQWQLSISDQARGFQTGRTRGSMVTTLLASDCAVEIGEYISSHYYFTSHIVLISSLRVESS